MSIEKKDKIVRSVAMAVVSAFIAVLIYTGMLPVTAYAAGGETTKYSDGYITGIEPFGETQIIMEHKLAFDSLRKKLPQTLTVSLGGEEGYDINKTTIPVIWNCIDNYDEDLEVYKFTPEFGGYELIPGLDRPVISVIVRNDIEYPVGGCISDPIDYEIEIKGSTRTYANSSDTSYNAFEEGKLPPVRAQGSYETCWAFSTIGAAEADLITKGLAGTDIDLSELHLAYFTFHNYDDPEDCHDGDRVKFNGNNYLYNWGSLFITSQVMANKVGPVDEQLVPYTKGNNYKPGDNDATGLGSAQLKGTRKINPSDRDAIKQAIIEHGSVGACIYANSRKNGNDDLSDGTKIRYSATNNCAYGNTNEVNHIIMLVGWDDSFSKSKFDQKCRPKGNGAWLVRNSWGCDDYGYDGYFWLSYYDGGLLSSDAVYAFDFDTNIYDHCYAYDGSYGNTYWIFQNQVTVSQKYRVHAGERVKAVSFETESQNVRASIKVTAGNKSVTGQCDVDFPGFYTVTLNDTLRIDHDTDVTVEINYRGDEIRITTENLPDSSGNYTLQNLVSTYKTESGGFDINGRHYNRDLRMKLFTDHAEKNLDCDWYMENGEYYWYENTIRQGTVNDAMGIMGDGTNRGREICDVKEDAWFWLDSVYDGAKATDKEVWIPYIYQDELVMNEDGYGRRANGISDEAKINELASCSNTDEAEMADQVKKAIKDRTGKWVRYDSEGRMIKGWYTVQGADAQIYTEQVGNTYYYDRQTGLMAKGRTKINGRWYFFDEISGVLQN